MLALVAVLLGALFFYRSVATRNQKKLSSNMVAIAHAELVVEYLSADLRSMMAPNPRAGLPGCRIAADGRALAFYRLELGKSSMRAVPVVYRAEPSGKGHGNLVIKRDGRPLGTALLQKFEVHQQDIRDAPRIALTVVGIGQDVPPESLAESDRHQISISISYPEVSPAAILGLPEAASSILSRAIDVRGSLPTL